MHSLIEELDYDTRKTRRTYKKITYKGINNQCFLKNY